MQFFVALTAAPTRLATNRQSLRPMRHVEAQAPEPQLKPSSVSSAAQSSSRRTIRTQAEEYFGQRHQHEHKD
jgi:hypothetical protein